MQGELMAIKTGKGKLIDIGTDKRYSILTATHSQKCKVIGYGDVYA